MIKVLDHNHFYAQVSKTQVLFYAGYVVYKTNVIGMAARMVMTIFKFKKKQLLLQVASTLKSEEKIQKCPKCRSPAKVLPVQDRGKCTNVECKYDFCTKCLNPFHKAADCISITTKKTKTDAVGSKKSKANLKRL